jgi:hypothetical protein
LEPSAGLMLLSSIIGLLENFDQIADLVDHAAHSWCILQFAHRIELTQTQATNSGSVRDFGSDWATHQLDFHGCLV